MNLIQSREIDVEVGDDEEKMVQGQKKSLRRNVPGEVRLPSMLPSDANWRAGGGGVQRQSGWMDQT